MGASQGVITIVRGAVPLVLFGAKGYGAVSESSPTPVLVVNATSPAVFAWIVDRSGWGTGRVSLLVGCSAAWPAMELMSRWYERRRAASSSGTAGTYPILWAPLALSGDGATRRAAPNRNGAATLRRRSATPLRRIG